MERGRGQKGPWSLAGGQLRLERVTRPHLERHLARVGLFVYSQDARWRRGRGCTALKVNDHKVPGLDATGNAKLGGQGGREGGM